MRSGRGGGGGGGERERERRSRVGKPTLASGKVNGRRDPQVAHRQGKHGNAIIYGDCKAQQQGWLLMSSSTRKPPVYNSFLVVFACAFSASLIALASV